MTPVSRYNTASSVTRKCRFRKLVAEAPGSTFAASEVATRFVDARRAARGLLAYPGTPPPDLPAAYRCQDAAIGLWDDRVVGWKVGWINAPWSAQFGAQRLVGPIFERRLQHATPGTSLDAPVYAEGFAAIEAEFVFRLSQDAPAHQLDWSTEQAGALVDALFVGIEIASSPLARINDYGPAVVVSDFGNNCGLLLGPRIPDWHTREAASLSCETRIDDELVGRGSAAGVSGGILSALAFALACTARRGRALRRGDLVSTGAISGVHEIRVGQHAEVAFAGVGTLRCRTVALAPAARG